ncbi:NAD-binding protein [Streptomyces xiaopingdaonensis]|uniref:NAD-binding protein n=1 Tax=Streptomyces xiaopingdaonensis TaxID=1565415 RepID=UPI000382F150|nr:NAD(P)-binding protein [Streptomyces xiaopingdaonensis]
MVVCGDNALSLRLVKELATVYGQRVTVVLPSLRGGDHGPQIAELVDRPLRDANGRPVPAGQAVRAVESRVPDDDALRRAGVESASALALTSGDDQLNIHIALRARRVNPEIRLVIRMFNRTLGGYLESLLDRAVEVRSPHLDATAVDTSTTVLSDADTAAPSLVAAAVVGSDKIVQAEGLLLRAKERTLGTATARDPLCTLALLPESEASDEGDVDEDEGPDHEGPLLLPSEADLAGLPRQRGAVMLEAITRQSSPQPVRAPRLPRLLAFKEFFSRRLRYSVLVLAAVVFVLAAWNWVLSDDSPLKAGYITLLDLFAINEPKVEEPHDEQVLQLLAALAGMLILPLLMAVVLESYGAFRRASEMPAPPRGMSGHVVLLGLGKVGSRVLDRLLELEIPVVCVERDPEARGMARAREQRVPTVVADVTERDVLEAAKIKRARALLALTSSDGTNLEASLYARQVKPELRVVMRLFDDDFAATVYRTLYDTYPTAQTRSRSVSALAAPAFAGAMMGRQVLGAIQVGRRVLVFAALDVADNALLEGRTVGQAFHRGGWRVLALDTGGQASPPDAEWPSWQGGTGMEWRLSPDYRLKAGDRVVVAATRRGLGRLLAAGPSPGPAIPGTGEYDLGGAIRRADGHLPGRPGRGA